MREFVVVIKQVPEHGYLAYCPTVNGKSLQGETIAEARQKMRAYLVKRLYGETIAEARKNMTEYLTNYLTKLVAQGKPVPKTKTRIEKVKIPVP